MGSLKADLHRARVESLHGLDAGERVSAVHPVASSVQYCQVKTTSAAVMSLPSDHFSPSFSVHVIVSRSDDTPPFSTRWNLLGQRRNQLALGSVVRQGLQRHRSRVLVLESAREVWPREGWRLPVQERQDLLVNGSPTDATRITSMLLSSR